jgi:hypothetical protein
MVATVLLALLTQDSVDTFGKTETEILKMGSKAWYAFYTGKSGESTYAMSSAYGIYGDIAAKRNERLLKDPKTPRRDLIKGLSPLLVRFSTLMVEVGEGLTGGGTMWGPIGNSAYADTQDTIFELIRPKGLAKGVKTSDVTKLLAGVSGLLKDADGYLTNEQKNQVIRSTVLAKLTFKKIVYLATKTDRPTSDCILRFCKSQAELMNISKP